MEIYKQGNENKNMHIKGEKQLVDLAESVKFMTSKFDELEKDWKEKEKIINNLKGEVSYLSENNLNLFLLDRKLGDKNKHEMIFMLWKECMWQRFY